MSSRRITACRVLVVALGNAWCVASAAAQGTTNWLVGPALQRQLAQPTSIVWVDMPLRAGLQRFSTSQQIAVLIDRRVDPTRTLTLSVHAPASLVLDEVIKAHNELHAQPEARPRPALPLSTCVVGARVVYVGPTPIVELLRTLAEQRREELQNLPPPVRTRLARLRPWRWDDATEPAVLLRTLADQYGLEVDNPQLVPHDLWAAADLPPLGFTDWLTLLAAQFNLTFRIDERGQRVTLVAIDPQEVALVREYPTRGRPAAELQRIAEAAPEAQAEQRGDKILVRGRLEHHERIAGTEPTVRATPPAGVTVYTLEVKMAPLEQVLEALRRNLQGDGIELRYDKEGLQRGGVSLQTPVQFRVVQAPLDDLLKTLLSAQGLAHRRMGKVIEIVVDQPP